MTKKLTIVFAVLTAVCVVAAIPLVPFAVRDTSNMLLSTINRLETMETRAEYEIPDGVVRLNIRKDNRYVSDLHLTHSDEKKITVSSNSLGYENIHPSITVSGDKLTLELNLTDNRKESFFPESAEEIQNYLAREVTDRTSPSIEISVPDGLVLTVDGEELSSGIFLIDDDVRYLTEEDVLEPDENQPSTAEKEQESLNQRIQKLRADLIQLVRDNAEENYDQLDFNMNLNDCRIRMENLLMEYAKDAGIINYQKYDGQSSSSSSATGISGITGGKPNIQLDPYDSSLSESEARSLIHELCNLYLSKLTVQAKLEYTISELESGSKDTQLVDDQQKYESQISAYTESIQNLEEQHTEFIMSLMDTGLLF